MVAAIALGVAGCVKTISPARTFDAYEHKAKDTAETALSSVETARLGARVGHRRRRVRPVRVGAALGGRRRRVQGARDLRQRAAARRPRPTASAGSSGDLLTADRRRTSRTLRIAARRGELDRLSRLAEPLRPLARKLDRFISSHE